MSRLAELIKELCPDGVEYRPLGEIGSFVRGGGLQKTDFVELGKPCVHYGQIHTRFGVFTEEAVASVSDAQYDRLKRADHGDLLIATTSEDDEAVGKATAWLGLGEVAISGDMFYFRHSLDPKYVSYFFASSLFQEQKRPYLTGAKVRRISDKGLSRVRIPVPPLEVQREIARILDQFTTLESELESELEARRAQYEHYRNDLLSYESLAARGPVEMVKLGDIATRVVTGVTPQASNSRYYQDGSNPWIRTQDVNFNRISEASEFVTDHAIDELPLKWVKANSVIVAISGASAGRSAILGIDAVTNQHCCNLEIDSNCAEYRYVYYSLAARYADLRSLGRGARGDLNVSIIRSFEIPLPEIEQQRAVADLLDRFDALVNDITSGLPAEIAARRAQYEHYRDRLLSFPEKAVSGSVAS
nr:restriction endonuclease subunit S [uncultured Actinomyces sp.]